jgi:hypothetical protein
MRSAMAVEPRMSAKSIDASTSAPPWCLIITFWHVLHMFGFPSDGRFPMSRMSGPPAPANGDAQSWQRGLAGMRLNTRRPMVWSESGCER